ncbi:putative deoxyribonuclease RhsC [Enhygromyxa salina]|uniref:Putative deoxyribonuclease RhsC n=1 Tax=Enhygromyxa salina TaxID=215803 RepID=A0A2S9Y7G8_9BACT|nr:putative toxin [Enhygromyxa salina]PRQ01022.1 putative deoxyribonuclease RhsC [Enhygromyxa salina]
MPDSTAEHRGASPKYGASLVLLVLACWLSAAPRAHATTLGSLLQHVLWAGPNAGNSSPQRTPSSPVGTIPGTFRVDERGAARFSIPLEVPRAARGLEPDLSLEYDSQLGSGALGVGWALGGQSAITRCAHTLAEDHELAPVRMTNDDALCLDGQRLVLVDGAPFQIGATYRLERDDFSRIRVIATANHLSHACEGGYGYGFEQRRRDGTIATYGCQQDATVTTHLGPRTWALSRVRDRFGNYADYRYAYESETVTDAEGQVLGEAEVEHYLLSIDYGAHLELHTPTRQVRFDWEPRPDPWQGWELGAPRRQSKRLAGISTYAAGALVHRYELDYDTPTVTGRSLITAVRHCDGEGVCKPATTFEWEPGELELDALDNGANFGGLLTFPYMAFEGDPQVVAPAVLAQTVLDANGDGRTDMLLAAGEGSMSPPVGRGWELWTSQPAAFGGDQGYFCGTSDPDFEACADNGRYLVHEAAASGALAYSTYDDLGFAIPPIFAADYDGDGRDDAYALGDNLPLGGGAPPAGSSFYIVRSLPEGGVEQLEFDPGTDPIWWFSGADQDGDGLGDLLFCGGEAQLDANDEPVTATGTWHFVPNVPGQGFSNNQLVDTELACSAYDKLHHFDHDGDGLASLVLIPVWDPEAHAWIGSLSWPDYRALKLDPNDGWAASLEPVGLPPDLAQRWRPSIAANYNVAHTGDDLPRSQQGFGLDRVLDVNDDGLPDILRYELTIGDGPEQLGVMMQTIVVDDAPWDEWGGLRLWINTGAGFRDGGWVIEASEPGDRLFRRFLASGVIDFDGDGGLDLLIPVEDPEDQDGYWDWSVLVSEGDGSFTEHPDVFEFSLPEYTHLARTFGAFDLRGDALHDVGVFHAGEWVLWQHAGAAPDKLTRIENGLGAEIEIHYRSLTDFDAPATLYALDLDACAYPERCERAPRLVVEGHVLDNGLAGDQRRFEHRYGMGRSDREGRVGLGFEFHETIEIDEQDRPIFRRRVDYDHAYDPVLRAFPHAGMPASVITDQRDPETGRHVVSYNQRQFGLLATTPHSYYPYVSQEIARSYELASCVETFCEPLDLDPDSRTREVIDTTFEIDDYGSPKLWTAWVDTGSTTIEYRHEREYLHDAKSWLLGLPVHGRLRFLELGEELGERDWVAAYDPDTGALETHILEPTEPDYFLHTSYVYDEHGNLTDQLSTEMGGEQRGSSAVYDEHGVFPVFGSNALGHGSELVWDPGLGVPIEAIDPNGVRVVADYDGLGHLTGLRSFVGQLPRGAETTFTYEMLGLNFAGAVLEIRSDTAGHGYEVTHYDRLGRVIDTRRPGLDGIPRDVHTHYDRLGRVSRVSLPTPLGALPAGHEQIAYDFAGRPSHHQLPDGTSQTWLHDGLETVHIDIGGSISVREHDLGGRLVRSIRALGTPDEEQICFDYGAWEQLTRARPDCVLDTPSGITTGEAPPTIKTFTHDDLGRLIASYDPSEGPRSYFYNGHDELELYVDGNDHEVSLMRDALGRVVARVDVDGETTWTWDLDFIGELHASVSPDGHEELFTYDDFGRVQTHTKVIGGESFELGFVYDEFDRVAELHYPASEQLPPFWARKVYAANGELTEVRAGPDDALLWRAEDVDAWGRVSVERFGNEAVTERSYDPLRAFTRTIVTTSALGGTLQSLEYQWSHDGTLERRDDLVHGQHESFDYDFLHRVAAVHTANGQQAYSRHFAYDSLGNLAFATDRGEYEYDESGRLAVADGSSHQWDQNGNLLARAGARPVGLTYTAFDKPATIDDDGALAEFEYDASQARVYRYSEQDARETIYVADLYQRHHDDLTGETEHHYYVPGLERIVANVVDTVDFAAATRATHYVHADHLGSTDVVSDQLGVVEQRLSFDVWGQPRDAEDWTLPEEFAELGAVNLGYTGHELQQDAGLVHMRGRLYDPHLGRMTGADPLIVAPTSTQGWNRYAYVLNRPLTLTDPSGFSPPKSEPDSSDDSEGGGYSVSAQGMLGASTSTPGSGPGGGTRYGGSSVPRADQRPGDSGPPATGSSMVAQVLLDTVHYAGRRLGGGVPSSPIGPAMDGLVRPENPSQEQRRLQHADEYGERFVQNMQDPPDYVDASIGLTMIFIGGDLELATGLIEGAAAKIASRRAAKKLADAAAKKAAKKAAAKKAAKKKTGGKGPVLKGQAGEDAVRRVYDIGKKRKINIHGRDRIPDGVTKDVVSVVSEVKNTQKLSYTRQLRDYADYAAQTGRELHLYVRRDTKISRPLQRAIDAEIIILRYIP